MKRIQVLLVAAFLLLAACNGSGGNAPAEKPVPAPQSPVAENAMPDLTGMTVDAAGDTLSEALGSYDMKIAYEASDQPKGTVISQTPPAGTPLTAEDMPTTPDGIAAVRITVSEGP